MAERALGLAARELRDVTAARTHLLRAIAAAERADLPQRAAEARLSLAVELVAQGRPAAALRELGRASRALGDDHPQIHAQVAFVYTRLGLYDKAVESNARALQSAERRGDRSRAALVLGNSGVVHGYRGDFAAAERDLRRAVELCAELGERFALTESRHNLAWVLGRRGRLPEALAIFDTVEADALALGIGTAMHRLDRAEVLLMAGLVAEASALASDAAAEFAATGHEAEAADGLLLQARAALLAGRYGEAGVAAAAAADRFAAQDRTSWQLAAQAVEVRARAAAGDDVTAAAEPLVLELAQRGLDEDADDVRLATGSPALLAPLAGRRRRKAARARTRAWQAELALRRLGGDRAGALRAAAAGLRALEDLRGGLGATDLHAAAAVHGAAITSAGLELALAGPAEQVLRWSEQARATTLQHAPVRPPDDATLAADLEQLRSVTAQRQQALLEGDPAAALHSRQLALEESVRRRSRHAHGQRAAESVPDLARVRDRLDGRRLLSLISSGGRLHALVVHGRGAQVLDLCAESHVLTELRHLRLALRRSVLGHAGADDAVAAGARNLTRLLGPALAGDGPLVVVPTPGLAGLPWSLLEPVAPYDVEVTPSVALWCRPGTSRSEGARIAVAGPDLAHAQAEVADLAALDGGLHLLTGAEATAEQVLAAIDGAQLAHLACHGSFRADNPLFSSLRLADGPLLVYDVERLAAAPEHVVLSACDSARLGPDLLGLAAAFFSLGTRTLIAGILPVDDAASRRLMVALHRHRRAGLDVPAALRAAQREETGPTAAAFVCLTARQTVSG